MIQTFIYEVSLVHIASISILHFIVSEFYVGKGKPHALLVGRDRPHRLRPALREMWSLLPDQQWVWFSFFMQFPCYQMRNRLIQCVQYSRNTTRLQYRPVWCGCLTMWGFHVEIKLKSSKQQPNYRRAWQCSSIFGSNQLITWGNRFFWKGDNK